MVSGARLLALLVTLCGFTAVSLAQQDPSIRAIATGVVVAERSVDIATKRQERITAVRAERGDTVVAGALLIETDDAELLADKAAAEAELNAARVERDYRGRSADRLERLARAESLSEDRLDEARYSLAAAEQRLRLAEARLQKIEALLGDTRLVAPFAGVIIDRSAEVGQLTQPGAPLLRLEDHSALELHARVKEREVPHIRADDPVLVTVDALDDAPLRGSVRAVVPSGDEDHTFLVEIELPEQPGLYPGMFGKAVFGR
jgi:RND family efflux transporter MFP subunit